MAVNTSYQLRNMVMYQVFVRNFSQEGTFLKVRERLLDIKALGADIIWLMPIHPIGEIKRKGVLGSPYAISDYRAVNPEFGTLDDLKALVDDIHALGMKCIIDVVYNHTSPDSALSKEHPEWFYHKPDGSFGNRVGDWTDIIDLDYNSDRELWRYQIDTLKMWAEIVDGFRCDVAPLIPLDFWLQARREVEEVRPGCIWLSESVEPGFITYMRGRGMTALSDGELYQAFDLCYDYDVYRKFVACINKEGSLADYAEAVNRQEYTYPANYVKLRFLENHDQPRAAFLIPSEDELANWTAFSFFQKGMTLIYAGQEYAAKRTPNLFNKDTVDFTDSDKHRFLASLMGRLSEIKRDPVFTDSVYKVAAQDDRYLVATHESGGRKALGIFCVGGANGRVKVDLPDGFYTDLINDKKVEACGGYIMTDGAPIIIIE